MIRTTLTLGLIVILAALLGAPILFGAQMAEYHEVYIQELQASGTVEIKSSEFNRGWFTSTSKVMFALPGETCEEPPCAEPVINSKLYHGPFPFGAYQQADLTLEPVQGVVISKFDLASVFPREQAAAGLPIEGVTVVDLDGSARSTLSLEQSQAEVLINGEPAVMSVSGLQGQFAAPKGQDLAGDFQLASFSVAAQDESLVQLEGLSVDLQRGSEEGAGQRQFAQRLDRLRVVKPGGQEQVELSGMALNAATGTKDGLIESDFNLSFNGATVEDRQYGPALLEGEISRIDLSAIQDLQQSLAEFEDQGLPAPLNFLAAAEIYRKHLPDILEPGPELSVPRIVMKTPNGDVSGSMRMAIPPGVEAPSDMLGVLKVLQADIALQMPAPMLRALVANDLRKEAESRAEQTGEPVTAPTEEQIDQRIAQLIEDNVIEVQQESGIYGFRASMLDGRLLINGEENEAWSNFISQLTEPAIQFKARPN